MRYLYSTLTLILSLSIFLGGCGSLGKSEEDYKKEAVTIKYDEVARNPNSFAKKAVFIPLGIVNEVKENNKNVEIILLEGYSSLSANPSKAFLISYTAKEKEERLMERDIIRVWGDFQKISTSPAPSAFGLAQINTADINVKYISRPMWRYLLNIGEMGSFREKFGDKQIDLGLSISKVNENSIDIRGDIGPPLEESFSFVGTINDNGVGKIKFVDDKKNDMNIEATIKITKDTIEFSTPEVKLEKLTGFLQRETKTLTFESGNYIFKINI